MKNEFADTNQKNLYKRFPASHYLSNPTNVDHVYRWSTFFRRNLHRLAIDYLQINLHCYQAVMLYLMGICQFIVFIACRAAAKSFIIALYACCRCIVRPRSKIVLCSGTKGQSSLIIKDKIKKELMDMSPMLRREIKDIKKEDDVMVVEFHNHSKIFVVTASENGRGNRSTTLIREEFRQIPKWIEDSVLSPFQIVRTAPYMLLDPYKDMKDLQEEPVDIYISSSWFDNGHWMWEIVDGAYKNMLNGEPACLLAFDESITLMHHIKTERYLKRERKKQDPLTWRIEFLNERVKENTAAFFTYSMLIQNQTTIKPWYPRRLEDVKANKKNPYAITKQSGEVRIVSCDLAFVNRRGNDNSIFSCMRLLPENITRANQDTNIKRGYKRVLPYLESRQGGEISKQALRIRQLYEDFDADYIVLDIRNGGIAIYDELAKVMYDEERDCEYAPLCCMNDDNLANRIKIEGAKPVIFAITASQNLNSEIAVSFREILQNNRIDLLPSLDVAKETVLSSCKEYMTDSNVQTQLMFEKPFLETQLFISETSELIYEKKEQTGVFIIKEQGHNTKDRYTSVSYGSYFASLLEQDLLSDDENFDIDSMPSCVSAINF